MWGRQRDKTEVGWGRGGKQQTLLVGIEGLGEDVVAGEDHDDREVFVDEGQDAVFELAGHDGFAVEVGDFFDLERACMHTTVSEAAFATQKSVGWDLPSRAVENWLPRPRSSKLFWFLKAFWHSALIGSLSFRISRNWSEMWASPFMMSSLRFCFEARSSLRERANIIMATNWEV